MPNKESLEKSFDSLFAAESDAVFRFCLFRVSDREQAMDLSQETFLRVWQSMQAGTVMNNSRAFLFTVARRLVIDWYRKKKSVSLEVEGEREGTDEIIEPADVASLGDGLELAAEGRRLIEKINELNPTYRQPVYLRFVEGLSPAEIGKILGLSSNTASVRITRGIEELRKISGYEADAETDAADQHE